MRRFRLTRFTGKGDVCYAAIIDVHQSFIVDEFGDSLVDKVFVDFRSSGDVAVCCLLYSLEVLNDLLADFFC